MEEKKELWKKVQKNLGYCQEKLTKSMTKSLSRMNSRVEEDEMRISDQPSRLGRPDQPSRDSALPSSSQPTSQSVTKTIRLFSLVFRIVNIKHHLKTKGGKFVRNFEVRGFEYDPEEEVISEKIVSLWDDFAKPIPHGWAIGSYIAGSGLKKVKLRKDNVFCYIPTRRTSFDIEPHGNYFIDQLRIAESFHDDVEDIGEDSESFGMNIPDKSEISSGDVKDINKDNESFGIDDIPDKKSDISNDELLSIDRNETTTITMNKQLIDKFNEFGRDHINSRIEIGGILVGDYGRNVIDGIVIPEQSGSENAFIVTNEFGLHEHLQRSNKKVFGSIHVHPWRGENAAFLSSIDCYNHYSFQQLSPNAISIVTAPNSTGRKFGIFRIRDDEMKTVGENLKADPKRRMQFTNLNGRKLYEDAKHVKFNKNSPIEIIDIRRNKGIVRTKKVQKKKFNRRRRKKKKGRQKKKQRQKKKRKKKTLIRTEKKTPVLPSVIRPETQKKRIEKKVEEESIQDESKISENKSHSKFVRANDDVSSEDYHDNEVDDQELGEHGENWGKLDENGSFYDVYDGIPRLISDSNDESEEDDQEGDNNDSDEKIMKMEKSNDDGMYDKKKRLFSEDISILINKPQKFIEDYIHDLLYDGEDEILKDFEFGEYTNNTHSVFIYRSSSLSWKEKRFLVKALNYLYSKFPKSSIFQEQSKGRLSGLPKMGIYVMEYPDVESLKSKDGDEYVKNSFHKYAICFDFPPIPDGGLYQKTKEIINHDGTREWWTSRDYQFNGCDNFRMNVIEQVVQGEKSNRRNLDSVGERYFIVHAKRAQSSKSLDDVKVIYQEKPVRSNPVTVTKVHRVSQAIGVKKAVKEVSNNTLIRGAVDMKISESSVHNKRSKMRPREEDVVSFLIKSKKKKNSFIKDVDTSHPKGGIQCVMASDVLMCLNDSLMKLLCPDFPKIAFIDTTFNYGFAKLTYILNRMDCFHPPLDVATSYYIHSYEDSITFKNYGSAMIKFIPSLSVLPDIFLRDDSDALLSFINVLQKELIEKKNNTLNELLCTFHVIKLNIGYQCDKLCIKEQKQEVIDLCWELFTKNTVEEFDVSLVGFRLKIRAISLKLEKYILKNKILKMRTRILKVSNARNNNTRRNINLPLNNHPIEVRNRWIETQIKKDTQINELEANLNREMDYNAKEIFKCILGLPSSIKFSERSKQIIETNGNFKQFSRAAISKFFSLADKDKQYEFVNDFSLKFPGELAKLGFPENIPKIYNFVSKEKWVMKEVPYDLDVLKEMDIKINDNKLKDFILQHLNSQGSFIQLSNTEFSFNDNGSYKKCTVNERSCTCEICHDNVQDVILNKSPGNEEVCVHMIFVALSTDSVGVLRKFVNTPLSLRGSFPELEFSLGQKGSNIKKKKSKKGSVRNIIREYPHSKRHIRKFYFGHLLFDSFLHKGRVLLSKGNLDLYSKKKDLLKLAQKINIDSKKKNKEELKSEVFVRLKEIASEKCVFHEEGVLGHCCNIAKCIASGIVMGLKGNDVDVIDINNILSVLQLHFVDYKTIIDSNKNCTILLQDLISCVSCKGELLDSDRYNKTVFSILQHNDKIRCLDFEESFVNRRIKKEGYEKDSIITSDFFVAISAQLRTVNIFISPKKLRFQSIEWCKKNGKVEVGDGLNKLTLEMEFGGVESFNKKLELGSHFGYIDELMKIGCVNSLGVMILVLSSDPNNDQIWKTLKPLRSEKRVVAITIVEYSAAERYQSIVKVGGGFNHNDLLSRLLSVWETDEEERIFPTLKHPRHSEEGDDEKEEEEGRKKFRRIYVDNLREVIYGEHKNDKNEELEEEEDELEEEDANEGEDLEDLELEDDDFNEENENQELEEQEYVYNEVDNEGKDQDFELEDFYEEKEELEGEKEELEGGKEEFEDEELVANEEKNCKSCSSFFLSQDNRVNCDECGVGLHKKEPGGFNRCSFRLVYGRGNEKKEYFFCKECWKNLS